MNVFHVTLPVYDAATFHPKTALHVPRRSSSAKTDVTRVQKTASTVTVKLNAMTAQKDSS